MYMYMCISYSKVTDFVTSHIYMYMTYIYIFFSSDILLHLSYGLDTISNDDDESITINLLPLILQSVPGAQERYEKIDVHV